MPFIQKTLVGKATTIISGYINYPINISGIAIRWTSNIVLSGVEVRDTRNGNMIYVNDIEINFKLVSLFGRDIVIDEIILDKPDVKVKWYREIDDVNISDFIYRLQHMNEDTTVTQEPEPEPLPDIPHRRKQFIVTKVIVQKGRFSFEDTESIKENDRFDFGHIDLENIHLEASVFRLVADTVSMKIKGLRCINKRNKLKVHQLDANFSICEHFLKLENLDTRIGQSHLKNSLVFEYDNYGQLSEIEDSVRMTINLDKAVVNSKDVGVFIPEMKEFGEIWRLSGIFKGTFNDFKVNKLKLDFGRGSHFEGQAAMKGLPDWDSTFMDFYVNNSIAQAKDLEKYGLKPYMKYISKFNKAYFAGSFYGYHHDFDAKGKFMTLAGQIETDFRFKAPDEKTKGSYGGIVNVRNLKLGEIIENKDWQQLTGNFRIDGKGFDLDNLELNVNSSVEKIGIKEYDFKNIISNIRCSDKLFQASLDIKDSNLVLDVIAKINLKDNKESLTMDANLSKADLHQLKLYNKPLKVGGDIELHSKGFTLDDIEGSVKCANVFIESNNKEIQLDTVRLYYNKPEENNRKLTLNSGLANLEMEGNLELTRLMEDVTELSNEISMAFTESDSVNNRYYATKKLSEKKSQQIAYKIDLKKVDPLCRIFFPDIYISPNAKINGSFFAMEKMGLTLNATCDTLIYNGINMADNTLELYASKPDKSTDVSSVMIFKSDNQLLNGNPFTEHMFIRTSWLDKKIDFQASLKQQGETNEAKLMGIIALEDKFKRLKFSESMVQLLDKTWSIDSTNEIIIGEKYVSFKNVHFSSGNQKVSVEGGFSSDAKEQATIDISNFALSSLNKLVNRKLEGSLNAHVDIKDFFKSIQINSRLNVDSLTINKLYIGNITGNSTWDNEQKKMALKMEIERLGSRMFHLDGFYMPNANETTEKLNITATLNKTHMVVLEPFIKDVLSDLQGEATGLIKVTGNLIHPVLNGEIFIDNGALKVNYLNTTYYFNEKIHFYPNSFVMPNIVLQDEQGGLAVLEGGIYHNNFKDFKISINGEYKNALVLSTGAKNNDLFYGNAVGTGNFSIKGNFRELDIKVNAKTEKGTKIYIPLNSSDLVEKQGYISFVKKGNTQSAQPKKRAVKSADPAQDTDLKLKMELNFDVTPDAYGEIILDPLAGDKIGGYGTGRIRIETSTEGDFNMYGNYTFDEHSFYLFTFLNIVNKKFNIKRGSNIAFNGDPYSGMLDITASYDDRISLHSLVDTNLQNRTGIRTPYPVSTILYLKGNLLKPTITYDIKITDYPSFISGVPLFSYVSAFENKIRNNPNEMNTQVFGLLLFRRFLYNTSDLTGESAASSTVSELLSNQLSQLVSKLDENLQVDFRMNGLTKDALNNMQLRVSYELLDGKIRITRSGSLTNVQSQATAASIAGDWTVEYMLTNDGKFRAKAFSKNSPNLLSVNSGNAMNMSTGVSIMHTATFNTINPFAKRKKKKKMEKKKDITKDTAGTASPKLP